MPSPKMSGVPRGPPPAADKPRDAIYVAPPPTPITEYLKSDLRPDNWDSEILHGFCMGHMGKQGYEDWKELKRLQQVDRGENKTWSYKRSDTDGFKGNDSNYTAQQDTPYGAGGTVAMAVMNGIGTDPTRTGAAKSLQRGRDLTQVSKSELMAHQEEEKQKHLSRYTNSHWIQSAELASRSDEKSSKVDVYQWPARDKRYTPPTKFVAQVEQPRHRCLHSVRHLVLRDPGFDLGVELPLCCAPVQGCEGVELVAARGGVETRRVGKVKDWITRAAEADALMVRGQEAGAPEARVERIRGPGGAAAREEHGEGG